ncbi:GtrA family protein [Accumulibacter sp.]|uniref:GtrA family protein n=1 Tax=Accumulibacter sp. TaxID=2053492 RepID=UPI0025ED0033|nr:GtrA family protein [Accumulibacter sp.]MCM8594253.1 GtrA family protein [Accumulibacter sp.]MCM8625680.1 GtrA family protein [Accumulibacter sp.]MDS4048397.1 GtrA family protein [Accumulibacter sp.]
MSTSNVFHQFVRYVMVGGLAFVVDFTSLFVLTSGVGLHYLVSASIAFMLGLLTNYLLCVAWIFSFRAIRNRLQEFTIFGLIGVAGLLLNNLLLLLFTELAGFHYLASKGVAAGLILFFNFSLRRILLFSERGRALLQLP